MVSSSDAHQRPFRVSLLVLRGVPRDGEPVLQDCRAVDGFFFLFLLVVVCWFLKKERREENKRDSAKERERKSWRRSVAADIVVCLVLGLFSREDNTDNTNR